MLIRGQVTETASPLPVLEYAPPGRTPLLWRFARAALALAVLMLGAGGGALLGRALAPVTWTTTGAYQMRPAFQSLVRAEEALAQYELDVAAHIAALRTPEALEAVAADVASLGHHAPATGHHDWLSRDLRLYLLKDSEVVVISLSSKDASLAHDVVDAMLARAAVTPTASGMPLQVLGRPTAFAHRNPAYTAAGTTAGTIAALLSLWYEHRRRAVRGATA